MIDQSKPERLRELAARISRVRGLDIRYAAAAALREHAALLERPQEATGTRWIPIGERLPEAGIPVLAYITNSHGKTRRLRAMWIPKHTCEAWDGDSDVGDYSEEKDTYYTPEGWYETNEYEETHFYIHGPVSHWAPLPPGPDEARSPLEPALAEATGGYSSGWVIEGAWSQTAQPDYWMGSSSWSTDPYKALRFATRESAQQAADLMCAGVNVRIACHEWAMEETRNEQ